LGVINSDTEEMDALSKTFEGLSTDGNPEEPVPKINHLFEYRPGDKDGGSHNNRILNMKSTNPRYCLSGQIREDYLDSIATLLKQNADFIEANAVSIIPSSSKDGGNGWLEFELLPKIQQGRSYIKLRRTYSVQKSTQRTNRLAKQKEIAQEHVNSMEVEGEPDGKIIFVIDDIKTTGATLMAAHQILVNRNPQKIFLFAIARTI